MIVSFKNNLDIKVRQCKYLNNIIEQDHRVIKRITKPMLGFKSFQGAESTIAGIELVGMIRKNQFKLGDIPIKYSFETFYALAG